MNDETPSPNHLSRFPAWLPGVGVLLLGAVTIAVIAWIVWPAPNNEPPSRTLDIGLHRQLADQTASHQEEASCALSSGTDRTVVISDAGGKTVGTIRPGNGTLRIGDDGKWYCSAHENVVVPDSAFYTFSVDGQRVKVISRVEFEAANWSVSLGWIDDSSVPAATPQSPPIRR